MPVIGGPSAWEPVNPGKARTRKFPVPIEKPHFGRTPVTSAEKSVYSVTVAADGSGTYNGTTGAIIQQAIDYLSSLGGGLVFIKEGIYYVDEPILLKDNVSLSAHGIGYSSRLQQVGDDDVLSHTGNLDFSEISGLFILGTSGVSGHGINFPDVGHVSLRNLRVHGFEVVDISIGQNYNLTIENSRASVLKIDATGGIIKNSLRITGCEFSWGEYLHIIGMDDAEIFNNYFGGGVSGRACITIEDSESVGINNNRGGMNSTAFIDWINVTKSMASLNRIKGRVSYGIRETGKSNQNHIVFNNFPATIESISTVGLNTDVSHNLP